MAANKFSDADKQRVIDRYVSGEHGSALAAELGFSEGFIYRILHWAGVARPRNGNGRILNADREQFVADYLSGMTCEEVAAKYGVKQCTAWEWLKKRGHTRSSSVSKRTHEIRENAFSPFAGDAAYWLGMLIADGCISSQGTGAAVLSLQLAAKDAEHVEAFRKFLGASYPVNIIQPRRYAKSFNSGPAAKISFRCRPQMLADLARAGITPNKSKTVLADSVLVQSPDFWRGVIDGDGSIELRQRENCVVPYVSLATASRGFAEQFSAYAKSVSPKCRATIKFGHAAYQVVVGGRFAIELICKLYEHGGEALPRKASRAAEIIARHAADPTWCYYKGSPAAIARWFESWPIEERRKLAAKRRGIPFSAAHRLAITIAQNRPEVRAKRSLSLKTSSKFRASIGPRSLKRRILSPERERAIIADHRAGIAAHSLMQKHGIKKSTLYRAIWRAA